MPDLYSKITLTIIAMALAALALRPASGADALAANAASARFLDDPAFEKAVAHVVNNYCSVARIPKGNPQHNLEVSCSFDK